MKRLWNAALMTALAFGIALGASVPPAAVPSAQAAVPAAAQEWLDFLHSMYVKHLDESDKAAVQEARGKLLSDILAGGESNLDPLVQFLNDHSEQVFTNKKIAELVRAFAEAITFEDSAAEMGDKLAENLQHPPVRAALKKLLAPSGLELDGEDGVGIEDAVKFLEALRLELLERKSSERLRSCGWWRSGILNSD